MTNTAESTMVGSRKEAATSFLRMVANGDVRRAFDEFTTENFRHHNAYFRGDAKSLATAMAENAAKNPDKKLFPVHVIEEGDLVAVHSRVRHAPDGADAAVVHIFRFEGDRAAELWDIGQEIPVDSPNENGAF